MITTPPTTALLQAKKQGKAMAIRLRDAIPFEICPSKKEKFQEQTTMTLPFDTKKDEASYIGIASFFCNIAVLCYFYVKRMVSQCNILALLDINRSYPHSLNIF